MFEMEQEMQQLKNKLRQKDFIIEKNQEIIY